MNVKMAELDEVMQRIDGILDRLGRRQKALQVAKAGDVRGGVPVGGRFQGDPPGRGEIPGRAVETLPTRDRVPADAGARGLPPQEPLDRDQMIILVKSAASTYGPALGRAAVDVEAMLWEETGRALDAGIRPFAAALQVATQRVVADVRARLR